MKTLMANNWFNVQSLSHLPSPAVRMGVEHNKQPSTILRLLSKSHHINVNRRPLSVPTLREFQGFRSYEPETWTKAKYAFIINYNITQWHSVSIDEASHELLSIRHLHFLSECDVFCSFQVICHKINLLKRSFTVSFPLSKLISRSHGNFGLTQKLLMSQSPTRK